MDGEFRKRHIYQKNIDTITNWHKRESHMSAYEKPTTTEHINIYVFSDKKAALPDILWRHDQKWPRQFGKMKAT